MDAITVVQPDVAASCGGVAPASSRFDREPIRIARAIAGTILVAVGGTMPGVLLGAVASVSPPAPEERKAISEPLSRRIAVSQKTDQSGPYSDPSRSRDPFSPDAEDARNDFASFNRRPPPARSGIESVGDRNAASEANRNTASPITLDQLLASPAWTFESDQASASLGLSVATAGDVNGDGYSDVIIGAPDFDNGEANEGRVFVFYGSATGLAATPAWTAEGNQAGASFGISVAAAGDVDGDGYADVLIGASHYTNGQSNEGRAFLYRGSASGLAASPSWTAESDQADAFFGSSVATAGDVNGDGFSDVIIGASGYDNGQMDEGRAYVYLGSASGLATSAAWTAEIDVPGASFGAAVGTAGDVNGDGYADVLIGAPLYSNGQTAEGGAFLYRGSASGLATSPAWTAESGQANANFGTSVATAGDVNGDGYADIIVGAPNFDHPQTNEGGLYVYYGSAAGPATSASWTFEFNLVNNKLGTSVGTAGDVNGDGYADIIGCGPGLTAGGFPGACVVYQGSSSGLLNSVTLAEGQVGAVFGRSAATAGDVNGDGFSDVIVGAPAYDNGQSDEGKAFVYLGSGSTLATSAAWTVTAGAGSGLGTSLDAAGDVNGDGYSDTLVGESHNSCDPSACSPPITSCAGQCAHLFIGSASGPGSTPSWTVDVDPHIGTSQNPGRVSVAFAGDVNGDGYSDVLVGAGYFSNGQQWEGKALVYYGSALGPQTTAAWTAEGNALFRELGWSVSGAGDVNGDGFSDILVGAPGTSEEAQVYLGSSSGLGTMPSWTSNAGQDSNFGYDVASAGDVNGDGFSDILVGAPAFNNGQMGQGRAFLYLGSPSGPGTAPAWFAEGEAERAGLGYSVAAAGDVNGDGYSDVIVGAPGSSYDPDGTVAGEAYLYLGSAAGLSTVAAWEATSDQADAEFGRFVKSAGDVNGDGYSDVVVGAPGYHNGQEVIGKLYLFLGSASGLGTSAAWTLEGQSEYNGIGDSAAPGDPNGDGFSDLIVGRTYTPAVRLFYGNAGPALTRIPRQTQPGFTPPLALLGKSAGENSFGVRAVVRTAAGRGRYRLEAEVKALGTPFDASGLQSVSGDTGAPGSGGSAADVALALTGLDEGTFYHWRLRSETSDPFFPHSPWVSLAGNAITETKFRTAGCVDRDGDGRGALSDPSCTSGGIDCNDYDPGVWAKPGEARNLSFATKTRLVWNPPAGPGGTMPAYDALRSAVASDFSSQSVLCVESGDSSDTSAVDVATPGAGGVFSYLVRARNACPDGVGTLGSTSAGAERAGRACP